MTKLLKSSLLALLFGAAFCRPALGAFHFGFEGFGGYASSSVPQGFSSPTLTESGVGLAAGFGFRGLMIGAVTDYRWISQLSTPTNGSGNRRGQRWNVVAPTVFIFFKKCFVQIEAELLGDYKLTNLTPEGARVAYQRPVGAKVTFGIPLSPQLSLGLYAEAVLFRTQTVTETKELHPPLNLWSTGAQAIWTPWRKKK